MQYFPDGDLKKNKIKTKQLQFQYKLSFRCVVVMVWCTRNFTSELTAPPPLPSLISKGKPSGSFRIPARPFSLQAYHLAGSWPGVQCGHKFWEVFLSCSKGLWRGGRKGCWRKGPSPLVMHCCVVCTGYWMSGNNAGKVSHVPACYLEGCRVSVLVLVILFQPLIATYRPLNGTLETTHPSKHCTCFS